MRQRHLFTKPDRNYLMRKQFCFLLILVMALWPVIATSSPAQACLHGQIQQEQTMSHTMQQNENCCETANCFCGDVCQCDQQQTNTFGGIMLSTIADSVKYNNIYILDTPLFYSNNPDTLYRPPIHL